MEMHHLFTPHHIQLLNACYPPNSALLTAGPSYAPNSHELSRLTYYASNHPGKLTKLGSEVEKRIRSESKKAKTGNIRARVLMLMSLAILRSLSTECRSDIVLLAPYIISCVNVTLSAVPQDLEVLARVASVFTAWTTYTNGALVGADHAFTEQYLDVLRQFAILARSDHKDNEIRNRTRLIGFGAVSGALASEALFNDSVHFRTQTSILLLPVLVTIFQADTDTLENQSATVNESPGSPYLAEFRTRPALERRAASIHIHIDGDSGPSFKEVADVALRCLHSLLSHANGFQLGHIMESLCEGLDVVQGWNNEAHCCWLARQTAEWVQYQYRYVVPTRLVEKLSDVQDSPTINVNFATLAAMITTVFTSPIPMINISSSDLLSRLLAFIHRRADMSPMDPLLPSVVRCIASLGCHIYYSDQIQDLAAEIINRIVILEVQGNGGSSEKVLQENRSSAIRSLLAALLDLLRTANAHEDDIRQNRLASEPHDAPKLDETVEMPMSRTRVHPEIYHDTLSLICDGDHRIRTEHRVNLVYYLSKEMPKIGEYSEVDAAKKIRKIGENLPLTFNPNVVLNLGDAGSKMLNAIHAYAFILLTKPEDLDIDNHPIGNVLADETVESPVVESSGSSPSSAIPKARKASLLRRLSKITFTQQSPIRNGLQEDYNNITSILKTAQEFLPVRSLVAGVPMLMQLDVEIRMRSAESEAGAAIKKIIFDVWSSIAQTWECEELEEFCKGTSLDLGLDCRKALDLLVSCPHVQEVFSLSKQDLFQRLTISWNPDRALQDAVESPSNVFYATTRGDNLSPLLKISPALMQIDNVSMHSLGRSRGLGVTDLREALEGRCSMSNPNLHRPASLISTLDRVSTMTSGETGYQLGMTPSRGRGKKSKGGQQDVHEVLAKLGIGKQSANGLLKASFPGLAAKPANGHIARAV